MIASLPMYDWPETREYTDQFWQSMAQALTAVCKSVPASLTRSDIHAQWQRDDLLLSQTCIYPLVTELPSSTVVVGTPIYNTDMCENGRYASVILVDQAHSGIALSSFNGSTLAYNSPDSQSGFNALKSLLTNERLIDEKQPVFFAKTIRTGSHRKSIEAVASGAATICAVDPVSWALAQRYDNHAKKIHVLSTTAFTPALPLISSAAAIPQPFNESQWQSLIMNAFENSIDAQARKQLLLGGITLIPKTDYLKLPISNLDMIT